MSSVYRYLKSLDGIDMVAWLCHEIDAIKAAHNSDVETIVLGEDVFRRLADSPVWLSVSEDCGDDAVRRFKGIHLKVKLIDQMNPREVEFVISDSLSYRKPNSWDMCAELSRVAIAISKSLEIKDVIFNGPATIVMWEDGTKTVVKCQEGDTFDPEKGLALAIAKQVLGTNESQV